MPTADRLLPYLRKIDRNRWYTNFGPLVLELEKRLSRQYGGAHVVTTSSGTSALQLALLHVKDAGFELVGFPALTFPATALAAHYVGLQVLLDDVDPDTWSCGYVAAFGLPGHGPGIVDAAGAFGEQIVAVGTTACFSLHATKALGAGEGGYIVTHDAEAADYYRRMSNFGILPRTNGRSEGRGINAKMSEYHAAVGLASLDIWDREPWLQLFDWYAENLPEPVVQQKRPRGVYPMIAVKLPCAVEPVMEAMAAAGIETRRWYNPCLAEHPLFSVKDWRKKLPVTADLSDHLLGLPYHTYLTEHDVARICAALRRAIKAALH